MKRHAVIAAIKAQHNHTEIARFLKVARFFVAKVKKHLQAAHRDPTLAAKRKTHAKVLIPSKPRNLCIKYRKNFKKTLQSSQSEPLQRTSRFQNAASEELCMKISVDVACDAERSVHMRKDERESFHLCKALAKQVENQEAA